MFTPFAFMGQGGAPAPSYDADAQAFFNAVTGGGDTLTTTEQNAVNTLVVGLKADGIWTKFDALYPFVGGTATAHKWNLINPADTDVAYRITWYGGWTHDANGVTGNDVNTGGLTYYRPSAHASTSDFHMSVYCNGGNNGGNASYDFGGYDGNDWALIIEYNNSSAPFTHYINFAGSSYKTTVNNSYKGLWVGNQDLGNADFTELYQDGVRIINAGQSMVITTQYLGLGCSWRGSATDCAGRRYGLASIGYGMDGTEQGNFYDRVTTFNTSLSRQA